MYLRIDNVLDAAVLEQVTAQLGAGKFEDGRKTAGWNARLVKNNLQLEPGSKEAEELRRVVTEALMRSPGFEMAARPKMMRPVLFARYETGMEYGWHMDDPMMGGPPLLRTDLAFTLFLCDPAGYDGGELVVQAPQGNQGFKLPAGSMVVYPSTTMHRVAPVTRGVRLVAISWVQSLVRDETRRELLYELDVARREVFEANGKCRPFDRLNRVMGNLMRMWAEP